MSGARGRIVGGTAVALLALAAFLAGRWSAPRETFVVREPPPTADAPTSPGARAERPGERAADAPVPAAAPATVPSAPEAPTAETPAAPSSLRDLLAGYEPPVQGQPAPRNSSALLHRVARETQKDEQRRAEMWALLETETDPAVLQGLLALMRRRPLSPATPADRDRAWDLLLRDGPTERRRAAGALWLLGEAWTKSADREERIVRALDGALPYELLDAVAVVIEEDALARDPAIHDALVRAVERAPPGADISRLTPSLSNPWVRHDTHRELVDAWRAAEDPQKRAKLSEAYAAALGGVTGGFSDGPPGRGHPLESPIVRGTVEIYAGTTDSAVRTRIAAGIWRGLRLDREGRRSLTRELAGIEPDAEVRARLLRLAEDPAACAAESGGDFARFLAGEPAAVAK